MTAEVTSAVHGTVLVLDDCYAVVLEKEFDRRQFEQSVTGLPFRFEFANAWDECRHAYTVAEAVSAVHMYNPHAVLLDIVFGDKQDRLGIAILRELTAKFPALPVVVMTSLGRDDIWGECGRLGAVDYLPKPLDARLLWQTLDRYVGADPIHWLIGQNRVFMEAVNLAAMAAEGGETAVMITGESGTGKGLLTRFIHRHGRRSGGPFEIIDLPNIPSDHQAANLFGYRKGAFTGADRDEPGRFLAADGGVVFLDEIGDIDPGTQLRLLRVADTGEVARLGDGKTSRVDVQLVTATNADLAQKIKGKEFRYDLWARLNGMPVSLPALAQRLDDVAPLARHLLRCQALRRGRPTPALPDQVADVLKDFSWSGNIRGLSSYAQRVFDLAGDAEPDEAVFMSALPHVVEAPRDQVHVVVAVQNSIAAGGLITSARLQRLRLDELALLHQALEQTRDAVTGATNRAKAAALLKGKRKCSTNEFDRWVKALWEDL